MPSAHVDPVSHAVDIKTNSTYAATVFMIPSQVPHTYRYTDELQDVEIIITFPIDVDSEGFKYQISSRIILTGEEHPLSHGSHVASGRAACSEALRIKIAVAVLDDRLAVYIGGTDNNRSQCWSLHVLSWQRPSQADDLCAISDGNQLSDIRFLVKEKLIAFSSDGYIYLYDTEDPSKAPRLHARFTLPNYGSLCGPRGTSRPLDLDNKPCRPSHIGDIGFFSLICIISARIFFMDIPSTWFDPTSQDGRLVTWSSWGPQNCRLLPKETLCSEFFFGVGGSRVIWASPVAGRTDSLLRLHMADFNPSAVARGIGKVIREPTISTTVPLWPDTQVTTYLPLVEVAYDRTFNTPVWDITLDEETMVVFTQRMVKSGWKMQANVFEM
ncbi:hypothetical protein DFJ58DRAFT_734544 [Suillus subalutaceus]|uniref:uncharacterized protein n=1 Tax=Suillus subalutaceus TaxID=48586 RepID=UPI001B881A77|nr:uncharacterized protein DFJ58DRAFT_734544 [Suillus subalutaceus]KAG1837101.1 hypothetical protein DFJ58DRAFT_734544 [Suillus subalutaceus]